MKSNWRTIGEIAAVLSVIVSLIFVGVELRLNRSVALNESFGANAEFSTALQSLLAEHPSVWRRGCVGEELSEDESTQFLTLVRAHDSVNFSRWQRARQGISGADPDRWIDSIAMNMHRYEGYRAYWRIHQSSVSTTNALHGLPANSGYSFEIENRFEEFSRSGISSDFRVNVCGAG